ncbi:PH domain-containing protein [Modestobacter lacusdianchii]
MAVARMRMSRTALLPVLFLAFCVIPLAAASPWLLVLFAVPAALAAWVLRVGVDVGDAGVTARSLVGARTVGWPELTGIRVGERSDLWLVTVAGTQVRLPVLRARDLPRLAALSGGRIPDPEAPTRP